jgi:hypothetical protein
MLPLLESNCRDPSADGASTTLLHLTTACLQIAEQAVLGTSVQQVICVALHNSSAPELLQAKSNPVSSRVQNSESRMLKICSGYDTEPSIAHILKGTLNSW